MTDFPVLTHSEVRTRKGQKAYALNKRPDEKNRRVARMTLRLAGQSRWTENPGHSRAKS
jgi:hypothetical protein